MEKAKELAQRLVGTKYPIYFKDEDIMFAKANGLVIVSGYSDDSCYLEGVICEEVGCFGGGEVFFINGEISYISGYESFTKEQLNSIVRLKIEWGSPNEKFTWTYKFNQKIPVEKFEVYDDDEAYCEGIIFRVSDLLNK